jgi:hypothetical protein
MTFANVWHHSQDIKVYVRGSSLVWIWPKNLESFKYRLGYEPIFKLKSSKHYYLELQSSLFHFYIPNDANTTNSWPHEQGLGFVASM